MPVQVVIPGTFNAPIDLPALPALPDVPTPPAPGGPGAWPDQAELVRWCHDLHPGPAVILLMLGAVYLAYGYWLFKAFMTLNFAFFGAWFGAWLGGQYQQAIPGGIVAGLTAAALCYPLMKWAVSITGAALGVIVGVYAWRAYGLDAAFAWSGGAIGGVFCGMLAFSLFRGSVMMFTSLQGAAMLVFGVLGLLYKVNELAPALDRGMAGWPYVLPLAVFVPAVVGLLYQHTSSRPVGPPPR